MIKATTINIVLTRDARRVVVREPVNKLNFCWFTGYPQKIANFRVRE